MHIIFKGLLDSFEEDTKNDILRNCDSATTK